jgi:hypothetical protein
MTEKELGKALLRLDADKLGAACDARELTRRILKRDRWRVRLLAGLTIALWSLAALGILLVLSAFLNLYPKQKQLLRDIELGKISAETREGVERFHWMVVEKATVVVAGLVAILALAAIGTVLLVLASRRATLRQVNANLLEISEQLKQLRKNNPP